MIKSTRNGYRSNYKLKNVFGAVIVSIIMLVLTVSCSSGPAQSPEDIVKSFLAKHLAMTDMSLVQYYDTNEQPGILEQITNSINAKKEKGTLDAISSSKFDLSKVDIKVLDQKAEYVDDEEVKFVKVAAKGSYFVTQGEEKQELNEDEVFILKAVGNNWKVTEKTNPWK
jgi:hypothetical protein